jgi:hypothetical protein
VKKIPTLFVRDPEDRRYVLDKVNSGCEWVLAGEGVPTRKYDGTCVMLDEDGNWWARREIKPGKTPPANFRAEELDETTGKTVGWEPIDQSPFVKFHAEAVKEWSRWGPGTYELCGPKVNGNPEKFLQHKLISHLAAERIVGIAGPLDYDFLSDIIPRLSFEGVVWHHHDGRMAKLKACDFPTSEAETRLDSLRLRS